MPDSRTDPRVARYIEGVMSGTVVVCRLTRLAVDRHLRDLERSLDPSYPYVFDFKAAQLALDFCPLARHWKGEWAGKQFEPLDWQAFFLWALFGWKRREDGRRRFREALLEVAKKNGKTFLAAIVALFLLVLDEEAGAEIYSTATKRDQAKLAWQDARAIVRASPALRRRILLPRGEHAYTMYVPTTGSRYQALSSDDLGADGVMPHGVINDELHRQVDRQLYDVLKYGSRSRRQPIFMHTTTAGDELDTTLYGEIHDYAIEVLEGEVEGRAADEFLALIYSLDEGDDWKDRSAWRKPNPGLGETLRFEDLEKDFQGAVAKPAAEAAFKRLRLNVRTTSSTPWIRAEDWDACFDKELINWPGWDGRQAFGGLDLASTTDLTSFSMAFPFDDIFAVRSVAWCPGDHLAARGDRDRAPYVGWAKAGWIEPTPGNVTDYRWIEQRLATWSRLYQFQEIGFDRARAADVCVRLADAGLPVVEVPQGPVHMTAPITRLEDLVLSRRLRHDGNPLLKWCVTNVQVVDVAGNLKKIRKANYRARIDAAASLLNALSRYMTTVPSSGGSVYDDYYAEPSAEHEPEEALVPQASRSVYDDYFEETP